MSGERTGFEESPTRKYFKVEFIDPADLTVGGRIVAPEPTSPDHSEVGLIQFKDTSSDRQRVAVISAKSGDLKRFLLEIGHVRTEHPEVSEDLLRAMLERNAQSYLGLNSKPYVEYGLTGSGSYLSCREASCAHNSGNSCLSPARLINDDSMEAQWCMTVEPKPNSQK